MPPTLSVLSAWPICSRRPAKMLDNSSFYTTPILAAASLIGVIFGGTHVGKNTLIRPALYQAWMDMQPVSIGNAEALTYDVVGPICESGDWLAREPQNWSAGDVFVDNRYISPDTWYVDETAKAFQPQVHYFVGGATTATSSAGDVMVTTADQPRG